MVITKRVVLIKIEPLGTYRTDSVPDSANDAILVENIGWGYEGLKMNDRPAVRASIAQLQSIFGGTMKTVTFEIEVKGSGTLGTPPELGVILRAAGLGQIIVPGASVAYSPVSDVNTHESASLRLYDDGTMHNLLGCQVTALSFQRAAGGIDKFSVTIVGHPEDLADVSLPVPTYDSSVPNAVKGVPFSIGGYAAVIGSMSFDMGLKVSTPPDIAKSNGYGKIQITGRQVTGSFDPEQTLVADKNWEGEFKAGTVMALDSGLVGTVAGNRHQITMPGVYHTNLSPQDRDGITALEDTFAAVEVGGTDNELSIVFT